MSYYEHIYIASQSLNNKDLSDLHRKIAETKAKKLEEYLNIEIIYAAIANTRLIGALSVMNNKGFVKFICGLVPCIAECFWHLFNG